MSSLPSCQELLTHVTRCPSFPSPESSHQQHSSQIPTCCYCQCQRRECAGVSLAIDDCYEVWDSGFISIPHSFTVEDLQPQLKGMLAAPAASQPDSALCSGNGSLQGHVNVAGASELGRQAVADMSRRVTTCKCYHDAARIWDAGSRSPVFGFGPKRKSTAGRARVSSARLAYPAARWHCTCTAAPLRTMPFW